MGPTKSLTFSPGDPRVAMSRSRQYTVRKLSKSDCDMDPKKRDGLVQRNFLTQIQVCHGSSLSSPKSDWDLEEEFPHSYGDFWFASC